MELTQVSAPVMNTMMLAVLVGLIGPVAAAWIAAAKFKTRLLPTIMGLFGYILAAFFLRSMLLSAISQTAFFTALRENELLYQLFLAFTLVLFEELVRFLILRFVFKNRTSDENGFSMGISWGATECLITLGLVYFSYYMTGRTLNAGNFEVLSEAELADLKDGVAYLALLSPLSIVLDIIKGIAGIIMQVFYTFVLMRGVKNNTSLFCIGLVSVVHLLYIYIPTLLILLPAGLIISTLFCTVAATLLFYYMREAYRRAKYYTDPKNQIN